jgi:hypothetical protein
MVYKASLTKIASGLAPGIQAGTIDLLPAQACLHHGCVGGPGGYGSARLCDLRSVLRHVLHDRPVVGHKLRLFAGRALCRGRRHSGASGAERGLGPDRRRPLHPLRHRFLEACQRPRIQKLQVIPDQETDACPVFPVGHVAVSFNDTSHQRRYARGKYLFQNFRVRGISREFCRSSPL